MSDDTYPIPDSSNRDYWRQTYPDLADVFGDQTQPQHARKAKRMKASRKASKTAKRSRGLQSREGK